MIDKKRVEFYFVWVIILKHKCTCGGMADTYAWGAYGATRASSSLVTCTIWNLRALMSSFFLFYGNFFWWFKFYDNQKIWRVLTQTFWFAWGNQKIEYTLSEDSSNSENTYNFLCRWDILSLRFYHSSRYVSLSIIA